MIDNRIKRIFAILCIVLMIFLPIVAAENQTTNETADQSGETEGTEPFINVEIPEFVPSRTLTVAGTTRSMARVDLYVNGEIVRSSDRNEQGTFTFPSVRLRGEAPNTLRFVAEDENGITTEKSFITIVDDTPPKLDVEIPSRVDQRSVTITGTVSEKVEIEFIVNGNPHSKIDETDSFSTNIGLSEGENSIKIIARDKAGTEDEVSQKVISDTTPLKLIDISPKQGALFYEGYAVSDIQGHTKPFADVELFVGDQKGDPEYETTADSDGFFIFKDVDLEEYGLHISDEVDIGGARQVAGVSGQTGAGFETSYEPTDFGREELESDLGNVGELKQDMNNIKLFFRLTHNDKQIIEEVNYRIGTCFSGNLDWSVINMVEYQSPNSLSPERLAEGTELISTIFKLEYAGSAPNATVRSIRFDKLACNSEHIKNDERYSLACKILPNSPRYRKPNDDKTMWYVRYDLAKLEGQDNFSEDLWEDLTKQMTFLLKMKVHYTYLDERGVPQSTMQQVCVPMTYHLDKSRVDPRDVLPDWLQEEGLDFINESITNLNSAIDVVEKVTKYAAIGCLAGFALKTVTVIYRRMSEWSNYFTDKADPNKDEDEKCPIPLKNVKGAEEYDKTQQDLTNEELQERCPDAASAWKTEAEAYNAYRWTCDRFLCKGTPARWTEDKYFEEVRVKLEEGSLCRERTGTEGTILQKVTDCKDTCSGYDVCYEHKGKHYVYERDSSPVSVGNQAEEYFQLFPCGMSGEIQTNQKPLYVTIESGNAFLEETPKSTKTCKELCTNPEEGKQKWADGACLTFQEAEGKFFKRTYDTEKGERTIVKDFTVLGQTKDCKGSDNKECYCFSNPEEAEGKEAAPGEEWDYRLDKTGQIHYPPYRYYKGRDESACFGLDHLISGENVAYLNPGEIVPAFQCVCTSQIRNRLVAFRNILQGLYNCVFQIKTTGKADHGVCKELFTQYLCKWMYRVISWFMKGCTPWSGTGQQTGIGDYLQAGTQSIFGGVFESTTDLLSDYDSPSLRNYIGVGQEAISNKICLGALTGNWGFDLEGFVDTAYSTPYHTSAQVWPADREYLTWDPDNFQSTYEYRIAWWMTPGCDLSSYSVKLACANQDTIMTHDGARCEQAVNKNGDDSEVNSDNPGCDCYNLENEKTHTIYTGRRVKQGQFVNMNERAVVKSPYRYDNVKLEVYLGDAKMAEKCIPEANRVGRKGVFYFPISDATTYDIVACRFDQLSGQFVCNQGLALWQKRGRAYFGEVETDAKDYYLGDTIRLSPFRAIYSDRRQCVHMQVYNEYGQKLLGEQGSTIQLEIEDDEPGVSNEYNLPVPLKTIESVADFTRISDESRYDISTPAGIDAQQVGITDFVRPGEVVMYIHEIGNNTYEYYLTQENSSVVTDISSSWQTIDFNVPININGILVNIFDVDVPENSDRCSSISGGFDKKPCNRYVFNIRERRSATARVTDQRWKIHVELRHAPGEENEGSCYDSVPEDLITYQGVKQEEDIYVNAHPYKKPQCVVDGNVCQSSCQYYAGGGKAESKSLCGNSGLFCCERNLENIRDEVKEE